MTETVMIDPRVALVEQRLLAQAIEAHLKNRALFLAQRVFELENSPTMMKPPVEDTDGKVSAKATTKTKDNA